MPIAIVSNAAQAAAKPKRGMHRTPDEVFAGYVYGDSRRATHDPNAEIKAAQTIPALVADQAPTNPETAPVLPAMEARVDPNLPQRVDAFNRPSNLGLRDQVDAMRANQLARDTTAPVGAQEMIGEAIAERTAQANMKPADATLQNFVARVLQKDEQEAILRGAATLQRMP